LKREEWKSRYGFVLAAIGSAVGLGSLWRFPYVTYDNGGGTFLIMYFFALFTAGIPILILEFTIGHKFKGSAPLCFYKMNRKWEWLGWWQVFISIIISIYYSVVISWAISYTFYSFDLSWGSNTAAFFVDSYLSITSSPFEFGGIRLNVALATISVWVLTYVIILGGIKKGVELANKIILPLLYLIMIIIVIRGLFLPGAFIGLNMLFSPDLTKLLDASAWVDAYGQVFFSLSVAFSIMITYGSYLSSDSDIINNSFITGFMLTTFSLLAGIAVFSVVGFMIYESGGNVPEKLSGIFLAFATIPKALNRMIPFGNIIGMFFFLAVFFAGLTSQISIVETIVSSLMDKLNRPRKKVAAFFCGFGLLISLIFTTGAGLYILDIVDHYINNFGIVFTGIVEVILLGWFSDITSLGNYANDVSDIKVGRWWYICIKFITPIVLFVTILYNLYNELISLYGGYSFKALFLFGWTIAILVFILGILSAKMNWYDESIIQRKI
jgi:NSS family neurotransmitter:Na+ symporter